MKDLPKPTRREVRKYIRRWETSPETRKYKLQEQILDFLFKEVCSSNKCKESVRLKVSALNNFYSTRIINTHRVSDHIHSIKNLKSRLNRGDLKLVEELSNVPGTNRVFYSFASKYCNRYNPEKFPIYDSYVAKTLFEYKKKYPFSCFKKKDLRNYRIFYRVIQEFRRHYDLEDFSLKEVDRFLWQIGKERSSKQQPRSCGQKIPNESMM